MRPNAVRSLVVFLIVASFVVGCGGSEPAPQSKSNEPPSATMTEAGKSKAGGGPKGK